MATEETLVLVKPDGVARGLTGAILARIEAKGYALVDIRLVEPDRDLLAEHYAEHEGKPFYEPLLEFMLSGPSVAIRLAGNRVIEGFRSLAGTTDRRPRPPARSVATSVATGDSRCSRTSCTARTAPSRQLASSASGSTERPIRKKPARRSEDRRAGFFRIRPISAEGQKTMPMTSPRRSRPRSCASRMTTA